MNSLMVVALSKPFILAGCMDCKVQAGERAVRGAVHNGKDRGTRDTSNRAPPRVPPVPYKLTTFRRWLLSMPVFLTIVVTAVTSLGVGTFLNQTWWISVKTSS